MYKKEYNTVLKEYFRVALHSGIYLIFRLIGFIYFPILENYIPKKGKIIDLGCGYGFFDNLLYLISKDRRIYAYDFIEKRLRIARLVNKDKKIKFIQSDILSFRQKKCDCIFMIDTLCYLDNYQKLKLIKRCYNALKDKKFLIIKDLRKKPIIKYILLSIQEFISNNIRIILGEKNWGKVYRNKLFILGDRDLCMFVKELKFRFVKKIVFANSFYPDVLYIFKKT